MTNAPRTDVQLVYPRPPIDPAEAARLAAEHFGLEGTATELPSERDRNFLIETAGGQRAVFKIANGTEDRSVLELQHAAMERIAAAAPLAQAPRVIRTPDRRDIVTVPLGGTHHLARMLTWVPGVPLAELHPKTPAQLEALGELLGRIDAALAGLDHPAATRSLKWDLAQAGWIAGHFEAIRDPSRRALVERMFRAYREQVAPIWDRLPAQIIHNDGNDYNVLVAGGADESAPTVGIIDFGDMLRTARVAEIAVAAAYAMLRSADPIAVAGAIVAGYNRVNPLTDQELAAVFPLVVARLAVSVVNSAMQRAVMPDDAYLVISEAPAWELLTRLADIHPRLAHYRLRDACSRDPAPASVRVSRWIEAHRSELNPVIPLDAEGGRTARIDLSVGSPFIDDLRLLADEPRLSGRIERFLAERGARVGIGEYDEARLVYTTAQYRVEGIEGPEWRTIHLGVDLFASAGTPVRTPVAGKVQSVRNNAAPGDYGPTVIVEHSFEDGDGGGRFYTLYGHLDLETLRDVSPGQPVSAGAIVGRLGGPAVNGGWSPHVHFQLITDLLDRTGEFPGVARPAERRVWRSLSPDPHVLAGVPDLRDRDALDGPAILARRRGLLGPNLSVSYRRPLHIVRGWMQHLYDAEGRRFLDAVNNVSHVGHSHPAVVHAGRREMAVLNTNTRYLHETVIRYAERLTATLPDPLRVCFFVNSGSEANELALRLAWTHTGRRGTIVLDGAYHGNTTTLVELSPYKCEGPGGRGLAPYARKLPLPDPYRGLYRGTGPSIGTAYAAHVDGAIAALAEAGQPLGAFLAEPILSCGGQIVPPPGYLKEVYARVRAAGGVAIADEVQVGFGRVGARFWGFETQDVVPDIVVMGKPAGNGHPLGVVATSAEIAASFANGMEYFSTFGGNPVSAAIGLAVLDVIERERLQWRALETGNDLLARLQELMARHPVIGDVRGVGLFVGIELVADRSERLPDARAASYIVNRMRDKGVLLSTDGPDHNVIKIKPPLCFGPADTDQLIDALGAVLGEDAVRRD
ncbi:MAG: aminotransferase class III-fold pyridoxal phosphate-dependent enzyme [Gemmatimonadota bacterium]